MVQNTRFSSCGGQARWGHRALTGFVRKNRSIDQWIIEQIVSGCNVSPYLGVLPPELQARIKPSDSGRIIAEFREKLDDFLIANSEQIQEQEKDIVFDLPQIGNLFGCQCKMELRGITPYGVSPWEGAFGIVCKLSFPEIHAEYALKIYKMHSENHVYHGPWFEIATAFAANRAEPRNNNPVYMASLKDEKYMLSKWAGDEEDGLRKNKNKNKIFVTAHGEDESRNLRNGRLIDWGETVLSEYGKLSYQARKFVRQVKNGNVHNARKILGAKKNMLEKRDLDDAVQYIEDLAYENHNLAVRFAWENVVKR